MKQNILALIFLIATALQADSVFVLKNIKSLSIIAELHSNKVDAHYKSYIKEQMHKVAKELGINSTGYHQRTLALIVTHTNMGETFILNSELVLGENVRRLDDKEKVYAITYIDREFTPVDDPKDQDQISDALEDAVDTLLERFADQYRKDNRPNPKKTFAEAMRYETDYDTALKKAKKEGKNLMLVLTSEYCPWCRKFEKNVLQKDEVNRAVHATYVPLILNRDKKAFPKKFTSTFVPVLYFIDAKNEEILHQVVGYNQGEAFLQLLK